MLPLSVELVMKSCAELSDPLGYLLLKNKKRTLIQKKKKCESAQGCGGQEEFPEWSDLECCGRKAS